MSQYEKLKNAYDYMLKNFGLKEKDNLDEEDYFNVYKSLGYINYQKEQFEEADKWFDLAAKIYPNNKFLQSLQSREYTKSDFITIDVEPIIDCMIMED